MRKVVVVVSSTVAGIGARLFVDGGTKRELTLLDATTTPGGSMLLGYRAD